MLSLRSLIAVVEEGGFSAAAKRIHRTQSAISLQVAKLEDRLGAKLLDRNTRSVALTAAGETFISYARRILELADEAALAVTAPDEATLLRVGFADYLAPQHLHTLLARFRRAHPNCDLSLILGMGADLFPKLKNGELDLVFAGPEGNKGDILWDEPLVWTGTLPADYQPSQALDLVLMPSPCCYRKIAFDTLTKIGTPWKLAIEANSVHAVQSAVRAGLGISVLPRSVLGDKLPRINDTLPKLPQTSLASYVARGTTHPYAQRFIDFLVSCVNESSMESRRVKLKAI
ncbi:LysR family transcriptional regulator [Oceaniferula flava]|uniref:LysR family transcriptional regulator n=1 Tax=Oceaniferula flava TaxID=2800421 RepID=UPI002867FDCC|nr:LysR family transcriptional regulator [Oceaniferula flavus]